jgi:hypothetical protein
MFKGKNAVTAIISAMLVLSLSAWVSSAHAEEMKKGKVIGKKSEEKLPEGFVKQGGLIWMPQSFDKPWLDANAYCNNTAINGKTGWRLPTKDELKALYDSGERHLGRNGVSTWSSTLGVSGEHYVFLLLYGKEIESSNDRSYSYVTCVR